MTYDSVLKEPRRRGHERVGAFWSARAEVEPPQDVTPAACRALAEAHDHRRRSDPQAFATWFDAQFFNYFHAHTQPRRCGRWRSRWSSCASGSTAPTHVETARALTNLARMARAAARHGRSPSRSLRRALAIQERELGVDHLDTRARSRCSAATSRAAATTPRPSRSSAARSRCASALLGAEHPLTLGTLERVLAYVVKELEPPRRGRAAQPARARRSASARSAPRRRKPRSALAALGEVLAKKGDAGRGRAAAPPRARGPAAKALDADNPETRVDDVAPGRGAARARPLRRSRERWRGAPSSSGSAASGTEHEWTAWGLISLAEVRLARAKRR